MAPDDAETQVQVVVGGVQRAGTTSLFKHLSTHPGLQPPVEKEIHFFDDESLDWPSPDMRRLREAFAEPRRGRLRFDDTPIYLFWPDALARVRAHNRAVRLIFIFRDPIERAFSHWRMSVRKQVETLPFPEAIREGRERLPRADRRHESWRMLSYVERGFYGAQLRAAFDLFDREQILLLRLDDLRRDHMAVLGEVAGFLGIAPFEAVPQRRANFVAADRAIPEAEDVAYLRGLFREDLLDFAELSGLPVADWLTLSDGS